MKRLIKFIVLILTISTCFVFAAFGCGEKESDSSGVVLNATEISLDIEKTFSLKASFPEKDFPVFDWSVDDANIVSVNERGLVTALRVGTATVTATCGDKSASCEVTVGLGDYIPAISLGALETVNSISVPAGKTFNFNPYVVYANKIYEDATFNYVVEDSSYGSFKTGAFYATNKTGKVNITVTADWRGADSQFLTKTFEIAIVDNVAITVNEGSFVGDVNLYTVSEFKGTTYQTSQEFRVSVMENGKNVPLNVNNMSIVIEDKDIATFSYATNVITAKNFGSTTLKIVYISSKGDTYNSTYNINVSRPVYRVSDKIIAFSSSQDKLDVAYYAGAGAKVVEAYQNGEKLTIKNNVISGYTVDSSKAKESIFLFYTEDQVGYKIIADVYGYVVRVKEDLNKMKDYCLTSIAIANDIDATEAAPFATLPELKGSINGLGHTIYNLKLAPTGIITGESKSGGFTGGTIRDIAFVNLIPTADSSSEQCYLSSVKTNSGTGTIENVYITTNMGVETRGYKNSAIFKFFMPNINVKNVVVEYPSMPITEENNFGFRAKYGLFMNNTSSETASSIEAPRYAGLYIVSEAKDGNPAPLVTDAKNMAYSNSDYSYNNGAFGYMMYASNDYTQMVTETSNRYNLKTTYKQLEEIKDDKLGTEAGIVDQEVIIQSYYMYPQYTLALNEQGEVVFTKLNQEITQASGKDVVNQALYNGTQTDGNWVGISGTAANGDVIKVLGVSSSKKDDSIIYKRIFSTYPTNYVDSLEGVGVMRFGNGVVRVDDYSDFITNKYAVGSFGSAWDVTTGYPQWKNTAEYSVKVTANGNEVNRVELVYDKVDLTKIKADIGLIHATETLTNLSYELISGEDVVTLDGATVTAIGAGTAFIGINFTMVGKEYTKYIVVNATMAPGEYEYADKLAFSAGNGKLYKIDAEGEFNEVELNDIFGMDTQLTAAYLDGKKIALSADKKYAIGASIDSNEIKVDKQLQLVAKNTAYNIVVDVYGLVLKTEEDLKVLNIKDTSIKLQGYYVLANDIECTTNGPLNNHFDYYANNANTGSGDRSATDFGFHGIFDGLGHTISGLYSGLKRSKTSGFFGFLGDKVTIKNVAFTNIRLTPTTNSMNVAYFFGYRCPNSSTFENIYIEYSSDFNELPYSMAVGLFQGVHNTARFRNVIVKTPTDPQFIYGATFGWNVFGGFADDNPDSFIEDFDNNKDGQITAKDNPYNHIFHNVYVIAAPASNGKILPLSAREVDDKGLKYKTYYLMYAANDYENLPEVQRWDFEIKTEGVDNDKVAYAKNLVTYDTTNPGATLLPYTTTEVSEWSERNNTVAMKRVKSVYRYDNFAGLYNALQAKATPTDQVGNWKISASGIVWNDVNA